MRLLLWTAGVWLFLCLFVLGFLTFVTGGGFAGLVMLAKTFGAVIGLLCIFPALIVALQQTTPLGK